MFPMLEHETEADGKKKKQTNYICLATYTNICIAVNQAEIPTKKIREFTFISIYQLVKQYDMSLGVRLIRIALSNWAFQLEQ